MIALNRTFAAYWKVRPPLEAKVLAQTAPLINWLVTEINYFVKAQGADAYDYKREIKSPKAVEGLRDELLKAFEKDKYRNRANPFSTPK